MAVGGTAEHLAEPYPLLVDMAATPARTCGTRVLRRDRMRHHTATVDLGETSLKQGSATMRSAILLSIAAIGLSAAAPASADENTVSINVAMSDLDLSKPADAARLRARIGRAARAACTDPGARGVVAHGAFTACRTAALENANLRAERAIAAAVTGSGQVRTARR